MQESQKRKHPQNWLWLHKNKLAKIEHEGVSYLLVPAQKKTNQSFCDIVLAIYKLGLEIFIGLTNQTTGHSLLPALSRIFPQNKIQINCVKQIDSQDPKFVKLLWQPNQSDRYDIVEINFFDKEMAESWSSVLKELRHNQKIGSVQEVCQSFIKDIKSQNVQNSRNIDKSIAEPSISQKASKHLKQNKDHSKWIPSSQKLEKSRFDEQSRSVQILDINKQSQVRSIDSLANSAGHKTQKNINHLSLVQRNLSHASSMPEDSSGDKMKEPSRDSKDLEMSVKAKEESFSNNGSFEKKHQRVEKQFWQQLQSNQSQKDYTSLQQKLWCEYNLQKQHRQKQLQKDQERLQRQQKQIQALNQRNQELYKMYQQLKEKQKAQIAQLSAFQPKIGQKIQKKLQQQYTSLQNKKRHWKIFQKKLQRLQKRIDQKWVKVQNKIWQQIYFRDKLIEVSTSKSAYAVDQMNDCAEAVKVKMEQMQETLNLHRIYEGSILRGQQAQLKFLIQTVEGQKKRKIKQINKLFQYDQQNPRNNFHKYVDNRSDIISILKTEEGSYLASYSFCQPALNKENKDNNQATQKELIISLSNQKVFKRKAGKKTMSYDPSSLIVGNFDLKILVESKKVYSYFGGPSSYFDCKGSGVNVLLGKVPKVNETNFARFEIHQVIYQK